MQAADAGVTKEQARRALEEVIEAARARGRKTIRLEFANAAAQDALVKWMHRFVKLNAENGICGASRIEGLRDLSGGTPAGLTFKTLRTDLTDRLEEMKLVQSLDSRRIRVQLIYPDS